MQEGELVGIVLVAGLVVFLVGAGGWKLVYDQPLREALLVIHADRRRRAWIHLWMIPAMFLTSAGMLGLTVVVDDGIPVVLSSMAGIVYALGAVCWIASLAFRLTVVPWAAEHTVERGDPARRSVQSAGLGTSVHSHDRDAAGAVVGTLRGVRSSSSTHRGPHRGLLAPLLSAGFGAAPPYRTVGA